MSSEHIVKSFDDELKQFDRFIAANVIDDVILASVTDAKIEAWIDKQQIVDLENQYRASMTFPSRIHRKDDLRAT